MLSAIFKIGLLKHPNLLVYLETHWEYHLLSDMEKVIYTGNTARRYETFKSNRCTIKNLDVIYDTVTNQITREFKDFVARNKLQA